MSDAAYLQDYIAISQLKARYCRLLDTKDWTGFAALFTQDFELDVSQSGGQVIKGRDAAVALVRSSIESASTAHQIHSLELEIDGDVARGVWAMQDRVVWPPDATSRGKLAALTGYGHYHERYVRQDGGWRIAASRLTRLHMDVEPAPDVA